MDVLLVVDEVVLLVVLDVVLLVVEDVVLLVEDVDDEVVVVVVTQGSQSPLLVQMVEHLFTVMKDAGAGASDRHKVMLPKGATITSVFSTLPQNLTNVATAISEVFINV